MLIETFSCESSAAIPATMISSITKPLPSATIPQTTTMEQEVKDTSDGLITVLIILMTLLILLILVFLLAFFKVVIMKRLKRNQSKKMAC